MGFHLKCFHNLNPSWRLLTLVIFISFDRGFCKNRNEQIRSIVERMLAHQNHGSQRLKTPSLAYLSNDKLSSDNFIIFDVPTEFINSILMEKSPVYRGTDIFEKRSRPLLRQLKSLKTKETNKHFYTEKRNNEQAVKENTDGITSTHLHIPDYTNSESQDASDWWLLNYNSQSNMTSTEDTMKNKTFTDIPNTRQLASGEGSMDPDDTPVKPSSDTLISSFKYPKDPKKLVYGNLDNLGITYGDSHDRIKYSSFRRSELLKLLQSLLHVDNKVPVIVAIRNARQRKPKDKLNFFYKTVSDSYEESEEDNEGKEVFDNMMQEPENTLKFESRRYTASEIAKRGNNQEEDKSLTSKSDSSATSEEDYDKNPGNPYTVYKNRYTQNWPWFFELQGNHMNVNPKAPQFKGKEPTGADLFFGRKWWYFNQDDYLPFR